jgi:putative spermidine/putrescine transport system ATP-binding protein
MSVPVELEGVSVALGGQRILERIGLEVPAGSFVTLLGASGSGKTTTLNVVAGFVRQDEGTVRLGGEVVDRLPVHRRDIGFVFQSYALFPHLSVQDNVGYALRSRGVSRAERARRVEQALELVALPGTGRRAVGSLSGGQQQRVALARALVFEPRVLLLDEPLAALDRQLREAMQGELRRIQRETAITTIGVTHDQVEALTMSDRIAILRHGRIEQEGAPQELYRRPRSLFVARFLGEANLLPIEVDGTVPHLGLRLPGRGPATAMVRPEDLEIGGVPGDGAPAARVEQVHFQGPRFQVIGRHERDGSRLLMTRAATASMVAPEVGDRVSLACPAEAIHVIDEPLEGAAGASGPAAVEAPAVAAG